MPYNIIMKSINKIIERVCKIMSHPDTCELKRKLESNERRHDYTTECCMCCNNTESVQMLTFKHLCEKYHLPEPTAYNGKLCNELNMRALNEGIASLRFTT